MLTTTRAFAPLIPLMATIPLSGCLLDCDAGRHTRVVSCDPATLSVEVSTTSALELSGPVHFSYAATCLGPDDACSVAPGFTLVTDTKPGTSSLQVVLTLPMVQSGTFPLPSSMVGVSASLTGTDNTTSAGLRPQSGTIVIESSTAAGFVVRFDMVLATASGQEISLSQGRAELRGCHAGYVCSD